jgi:hypothetical protein
MPISKRYEPCPELQVLGVEALSQVPNDSVDMDYLVTQFESLQDLLLRPLELVGQTQKSKYEINHLKKCIQVGQFVCRNYDGHTDLCLGNRSGERFPITLQAVETDLEAALDLLDPPRMPSRQNETGTVLGVDPQRGIVNTTLGPVQYNDADITSTAISLIGREVSMVLDCDAAPIRLYLPELVFLENAEKR